MFRQLRTEGIVLRKRNLLGKDILLTFFSSEYGKIHAIAKGIKKITSRRASHVQTGNLVFIECYRKSDRLYLQHSRLISAFSQIKKSSKKMSLLYRCLFIIDRLLPELQPELNLYEDLKRFLITISQSEKINEHDLLEGFLTKLLRHLGYGEQKKTLIEQIMYIQELIGEKIPESDII